MSDKKKRCETCRYYRPLNSYSAGIKVCHFCFDMYRCKRVENGRCLDYRRRRDA